MEDVFGYSPGLVAKSLFQAIDHSQSRQATGAGISPSAPHTKVMIHGNTLLAVERQPQQIGFLFLLAANHAGSNRFVLTGVQNLFSRAGLLFHFGNLSVAPSGFRQVFIDIGLFGGSGRLVLCLNRLPLE